MNLKDYREHPSLVEMITHWLVLRRVKSMLYLARTQ